MGTFGQLIDRAYREYLTRPQDQPVVTRLAADLNPTGTTFILTVTDLAPEEQSLILPASIIELDRELMRVTDFDPDTGVVSVGRASLGTAQVAHTAGIWAVVAPAFTRQSVFDACLGEIDGLYPELWVTTMELMVGEPIAPVPELYYLDVMSAVDSAGDNVPVAFVKGFGDFETNAGVQVDSGWWGEEIWVNFKRKVSQPTAESDDLSELGLEPAWEEIVLISAVGLLLRGREFDLVTPEYLTEALEGAALRAGSVTDIATNLLRYRQYLLDRAMRALNIDHGVRVQTARVI